MSAPNRQSGIVGHVTIIVLLALPLWLGCSSEESEPPTASGADFEVAALLVGETILQPGDSTEVSAWVLQEDEVPVTGVTVDFAEVGHADFGSFTPERSVTDSLGFAHAWFRCHGTASGRADLKALAGGDIGYASLYVVPAGQSDLQIRVSSAEAGLPADGESTLELRVEVQQTGSPAPERVVKLAAGELFDDRDHDGICDVEDGELLEDADEDGAWDAIGAVTSPVTTDASGVATATYTAGLIEGPVYIKALVDTVQVDFELSLYAEQLLISVSTDRSEVWADGWSDVLVTARVVDHEDEPQKGVLVRFTAGEPFEDQEGPDGYNGFYDPGESFTDLNGNGVWDVAGTITSAAHTNHDGVADVNFFAGTDPLTATVYATTHLSRSSTTLRLATLPRVHSIETHWEDAWLYANGISSTTLTLTPYDVNHDGLPGKRLRLVAGEPFTDVDGNGRFDARCDILGEEVIVNGAWDALGTIDSVATADLTNTIRTTYLAPNTPGTATIKVSADDWSCDLPFEVRALPDVINIFFRASDSELALLGSGGEDRTTLRAGCDIAGALSAPAGVPVTLEIVSGPGGGEGFEPEGAQEITVLTDNIGEASAELRAGTEPGLVQVQATCGDVTRNLEVGVSVGPAAQITIDANDQQLGSWEQTLVQVVVRDAYNNPVQDGTIVYWSVDEGLIRGDGGAATSRTSGGNAWATYSSLAPDPQGDGLAVIEASVEPDLKALTQIHVPVSEEAIRQMDVYADERELVVAGEGNADHTVLRAVCEVGPDEPAPSGLPVTFEIVAGPDGGETINEETGAVVAYTDEFGWAQAHFRSGTRSGAVTVRVSANQGAVERRLYLGVSAGEAAGLVCYPQNGTLEFGRETTIHAIVHDAHNNPVADGTVVFFEVDAGFIYATGGTGSDPTVAGRASASYQAPQDGETELEVATVTAHTAGGTVVGETHVYLPTAESSEDPGAIARIELAPTLSEIGVRETGAVEQCELIATCYDINERRVGRDRDVTFEITAGRQGGENLEGVGWGPVTRPTDDEGQARVTLQSGTISGTVRIEASADSVEPTATLVSIAAGQPAYISLGIAPLNIRGWDVVGAEADLTAIVSDVYGNPVRDGTSVYFTSDEGVVRGWDGNLGSAVTAGGIALADFLSGAPRDDGLVEVCAETSGGEVTTCGGLITSGPPASVTFVAPAPPVYLVADGEDQCLVTVEVLDVNDNYVVEGTEVGFRIDHGEVDETALTSDGVYGSVAQANVTSEVLGADHSYSVPDDGIGALAQLEAFAGLGGAVGDVLEVTLLTGTANRNNSLIAVETSVPVSTTIPFDIEVKDRYGNPLGGHVFSLSASGGASVSPSATSDSWGIASALFTAPASDTTCVITAVDEDPEYGGGMMLMETVAITD
ncbi:MAG: hypothetical protein GF330_12375 [Candidatus Eisenbacteria bacterium]|nr:hypothetical protein [Candidatus Eisenbacteria bacterium]